VLSIAYHNCAMPKKSTASLADVDAILEILEES
jgi:hypothetical protein